MAVRFILVVAAFALATAVQAQTLPASPSRSGNPPDNPLGNPGAAGPVPPGTAGRGLRHRQPTPQDLRQGGADTRRIQSETDELYQEIMRRSAPPTDSR